MIFLSCIQQANTSEMRKTIVAIVFTCILHWPCPSNADVPAILDVTKFTNILDGIPRKVIDNIPGLDAQQAILDYNNGLLDEDIYLNITQLITKYGFQVEEHQIETSDGYILSLFRIPGKGPPVYLMHAILCSAVDFVSTGPDYGLAYALAFKGYDVWFGSARGAKHSRAHVSLSPDTKEFWDFSWHEIGVIDLAAFIDYILEMTDHEKVKFIGHSQGNTNFFVLCSERPEYNDKISIAIILGTVAWEAHTISPLVRLSAPSIGLINIVSQAIGLYEFSPNTLLLKSLQEALCGTSTLATIVCGNILFLIAGFDYNQLNFAKLPTIFNHSPSSISVKQLIHFGQLVEPNVFRQFDYGQTENLKRYGNITPPDYPVEKITAPVAIFWSTGDWLSVLPDVVTIRDKLPNVVEFYRVPHDTFNHVDYIWAKDVNTLVYPKIFELLEIY